MWDSEEKALRAACCIDPDEMTPRLVLADYLQEDNRIPEAEFIRQQIEFAHQLAAHPRATGNDENVKASAAMIREQFANFEDWPAHLLGEGNPLLKYYRTFYVNGSPCPGVDVTGTPDAVLVRMISRQNKLYSGGLIFKRGLLDSVFLPVVPFIKCAEYLFKYHPIRFVYLSDRRAAYVVHLGLTPVWIVRGSHLSTATELQTTNPFRMETFGSAIPRCLIGDGINDACFEHYRDCISWLSRRVVSYGRASAHTTALHDARLALSLYECPPFYELTEIDIRGGTRATTRLGERV